MSETDLQHPADQGHPVGAGDPAEPTRRGHHRRANWPLRILIAVAIVAGLLVAAGARYYSWCGQADGPRRPVTFTVAEGASGGEVVDALHAQGVLRCGQVSKWYLQRSGKQDEIRAGSYELTTNMTPDQAFGVITAAPTPVPTRRLTIPEGYRVSQTAERVQEDLRIPADRFEASAESGEWSLPPYLPEGMSTTEGFLFPQTYEFVKGETTADDVVRRLLDEFRTETADLPWENAGKLGVTPYETVVIASMIEEEAKVQKDRPLISGVIYNRLRLRMTLGIDATLLYDDPTPDGQLSESDLQYDSPYNTRLRAGLPPTPISSPGLASLEAALNPASTKYLYYVLCGADGSHRFAVTYREHLRNVAVCLG